MNDPLYVSYWGNNNQGGSINLITRTNNLVYESYRYSIPTSPYSTDLYSVDFAKYILGNIIYDHI